MTHWWRAYDDAINHPKLLRLSDAMHRAWFTLQCIASSNGGILPPADDIAITLRMKPAKVRSWIDHLRSVGLMDESDGIFSPHNWQERQFQSDNSTARVNRYRDKRRAAGLPQMGDYSIFRPALVQRDGDRCVYCLSRKTLVVDHMTPITLGGTDHPDNLALACRPCNAGKAGRTPEMARMVVKVASAADALNRYRDRLSNETVTVTAPEQKQKTDTEQSRTAAPPIDEDLKRRATALGAAVSAHFVARSLPIPDLRRCEHWLREGFHQGTVLAAVELVLKRGKPISTLEYFDGAIMDQHEKAPAGLQLVKSNKVLVRQDTDEFVCWNTISMEKTGKPLQVYRQVDEEGRECFGILRDTKYPEGFNDFGERVPSSAEDAA